MNLLDKFYSSFMQEIVSRQLANEDGETQEQAFTRYVLDLLSEAGETENAAVAFDEKALGTSKQHKINGFAISDNYETIDLFISLYEVEEQVYTVQKSEVTRAATRITNFFRKAVYDDYVNEVAESSEIFEFAHTLANYGELKDNLIRVNVSILTNGEYKGDIPDNAEICGYKIFYRVVDIKYIYQISEESHVPIEIDFKEEGLKGKKYNVNQEWMMTIAYYRGVLEEYENHPIIKKLIEKSCDCDYIIAPIVDNRMFQIINSFIMGEITDEQCKHCLAATNLGYQYVFKSDKAIKSLKMLERCYISEKEKEYYKKMRNSDAKLGDDKVKLARIKYRGKGRYIDEILK